ncbi:MAG: aminotransferase [Rhodospirillaceae bacterium]|nr:aminotransferase [Rhodospirillaceae bacterium]
MNYRVNPLFSAVAPPPIAEAWGWVEGRTFPEDKPLIDLAQAEPSYPPAPELLAHLAEEIHRPELSRYTDILGTAELRAAFAGHLSEFYGADVAPAYVSITAGCNQAFCLAAMALVGVGDEVILPAPYYFNHDMWLKMLGAKAVPLSFQAVNGGVPDVAEAADKITARTRAIVLVSPNNPTGAIYPPAVIWQFFELARERGIALVLDETYKDFLPTDGAPHDLLRAPDWPATLIQLFSFSKAYSLTGHRVGGLVAGPEITAEITKGMDCAAICAPAVGQAAALFGLENLAGWKEEKRELSLQRLAALRQALARNDLGYELVSAGAFFAYMRHPHHGKGAAEVARRLADEQNMLCLPGNFFGPGQDSYLRFSFANVEADRMDEIAKRLADSQGEF